jgi:SpoVK/Ycf46/Vps4 family AAA+-type ATPase
MNEFESLKDDIAKFVHRLEHWTAASQLPTAQTQRINQLAAALKSRPQGTGALVLFTGPGGTGKTMAAQLLANDLNTAALRIDLTQVVSRYIGETEKNLNAIFAAAESNDAILFFDEADALFGKRSEIEDSHDRYANLEASVFFERAKAHGGLVILACDRPIGLLQSIEHVVDISTSAYPCD